MNYHNVWQFSVTRDDVISDHGHVPSKIIGLNKSRPRPRSTPCIAQLGPCLIKPTNVGYEKINFKKRCIIRTSPADEDLSEFSRNPSGIVDGAAVTDTLDRQTHR